MGTDSLGRQIIRYTVRIDLRFENPSKDRSVEYKAVTSLGELKAAAMAALRIHADDPEARFAKMQVINREADFKIDRDRDLLDYWEEWTSRPAEVRVDTVLTGGNREASASSALLPRNPPVAGSRVPGGKSQRCHSLQRTCRKQCSQARGLRVAEVTRNPRSAGVSEFMRPTGWTGRLEGRRER
jgi:hypothetical protein